LQEARTKNGIVINLCRINMDLYTKVLSIFSRTSLDRAERDKRMDALLDEIDKNNGQIEAADREVARIENKLGIFEAVPGRAALDLTIRDFIELADKHTALNKQIKTDMVEKERIAMELFDRLKIISSVEDIADFWRRENKQIVRELVEETEGKKGREVPSRGDELKTHPASMIGINRQIIAFIDQETTLNKQEREIKASLLQGLNYNQKIKASVLRILRGLIPSDITSPYTHAATNLDKREEHFLFGVYGPAIIKIHGLLHSLKGEIESENEHIQSFASLVLRIELIQEGKVHGEFKASAIEDIIAIGRKIIASEREQERVKNEMGVASHEAEKAKETLILIEDEEKKAEKGLLDSVLSFFTRKENKGPATRAA